MQVNIFSDNKERIDLGLLLFSLVFAIIGLFFPFIYRNGYILYSYIDLASLSMYIVSLILVVVTLIVVSRISYSGEFNQARILSLISIASFMLFLFLIDNFAVKQTANITFGLGLGFIFFFVANVLLLIVVFIS